MESLAEPKRPCVHCEVIQALETAGTINMFVICLDKPDVTHNVIDREFGLGLARAVYLAREKAGKGEVDVVVLCSAKERSFLAGADIAHEMRFVGVEGAARAFIDLRGFQGVLCALESLPVPTIAIMNGAALGGGLEVALACDYRVADTQHCTQIGLPEVKLGYLPGAGGCCRLPRLIGFRRSLELIITGKAVGAQAALHLGIVDHLMAVTDTAVMEDSHGQRSYDYKWLSGILSCIEQGKVGKRDFHVPERDGLSAVDACLSVEERLSSLSEDQLLLKLSESWDMCEKKAAQKYSSMETSKWRVFRDYVGNLVIYAVALHQLWRTVQLRMPAPYAALQTTYRCYYATSWLESMQLNAVGFTSLATTAESKSLSSLFLMTRKLKRLALTFGLGSDEAKSPTLKEMDKDETVLVVVVSKEGIQFSAAFIQGLLYSGLEVHTISCTGSVSVSTVKRSVEKYFDYSLKRGHMKPADITNRMARLHLFSNSSILGDALAALSSRRCCIVVNAALSGESDAVVDTVGRTFPKVVYLDLSHTPQTSNSGQAVLVNLGDPVRRNTLCVELTPASAKVPPEDIRMAAQLISALGKVPVVTPPSSLLSVSHYLTVHHWSLAAMMMSRGGVSPTQIDDYLVKAGFTAGPFAAMKQLDKAYLSEIVQLGSRCGIDCTVLQSFINGSLRVKYRRGKVTPPADIVDLFLTGAVNAALLVKKLVPDTSEAAVDVLAVSGLLHFPPGEGGPLNYVTRVGASKLILRLRELTYTAATASDAETILASSQQLANIPNELFVTSTREGTEGGRQRTEFEKRRSELIALSAEDLRIVGPTRGVTNSEVFLYPLPAALGLAAVLLLLLILIPVLFYVALSILF